MTDRRLAQSIDEIPDPKETNAILKTTRPAHIDFIKKAAISEAVGQQERCIRSINQSINWGWHISTCILSKDNPHHKDFVRKLSQKYHVEYDSTGQCPYIVSFYEEPGYYEKNWLGTLKKKQPQ